MIASLESAEQPLRTPTMRRIAKSAAKAWRAESAKDVYAVCDELAGSGGYWRRAAAFEIARAHRGVFASLERERLERLGRTLDGWASVDHFARLLSGRCWREGRLSDAEIMAWAHDDNVWRRRAAMVSTIALNERDQGQGDASRTLAVCDVFVDTREDTLVKALSWALRELCQRDRESVAAYLEQHRDHLAPRVLREVERKLSTGHKQGRPSPQMRERWNRQASG